MTRIGSGGIEPSSTDSGLSFSVVNDLGKPMLPEVVVNTLLARGDAAGVPAIEPIREIVKSLFNPRQVLPL